MSFTLLSTGTRASTTLLRHCVRLRSRALPCMPPKSEEQAKQVRPLQSSHSPHLHAQKFNTAASSNINSATAPDPVHTAAQRSQAIARHFSTSAPPQDNMNLYTYSKTPSEYAPRTVGQPYTLDYRCYIEKNGQPVSPFHDIPLYANEQQTILNMIVEIPRWSNAKQEVRQKLQRRRTNTDKV